VDRDVLDRNPFRGLSRKGKGRADTDPPTAEEFERLLHACDVHEAYAPHMRSLVTFAAYTGMRPGELFALERKDIDMDANRVHVQRRVYRGKLDLPKSNKTRVIALPPPARDALLRIDMIPEGDLVFGSKRARRLSQPTMSGYWAQVTAAAGLKFDFYLATKHRCVHHMYVEQGLAPHVIAAQMGWGLKGTIDLLEVYSHHRIGALEAIDRAYAEPVQLRAVKRAN
jgi:integrase